MDVFGTDIRRLVAIVQAVPNNSLPLQPAPRTFATARLLDGVRNLTLFKTSNFSKPQTVRNLTLFATSHCSKSHTVRNLTLFANSQCSQPHTVRNLTLFATSHCSKPHTVRNLTLFETSHSEQSLVLNFTERLHFNTLIFVS